MSRPLIALTVAVVAFAYQQTSVVPAIPTVQAELETSRGWAAWLLTGYLVSASVLTPLLGTLGDRHGRRRVLLWAMGVFLVGSVGAALAPSIGVLIACRLLQGAGGAVFPLALALARDAMPERLGYAAGVLTGAFGIGTSLGVGLAGVVVEFASWRWVFAAGAVAIALAVVFVLAWVPTVGARAAGRLDVGGAVLLSGGLGTLLLGLTEDGWLRPAFLTAAAALLAWWVAHERRVEFPLVDLAVLRRRTVLATNVAGLLLGYIMFGVFVIVPYLVEESLGAGPLEVGLYLLPSALGQVIGGPLAGPLAARTSPRAVYTLGVTLAAASAAGLAVWHSSAASVLVGMTLLGLSIGLAIGVSSALIAASVPDTDTGVAASLNAVVRRVGGSVGGQAAAAVLAAGAGYGVAFGLCAVVALAGAAVAAQVRPEPA